ncbi:Sulfhydryl oxidase 1 [Holothuria leucospilota]|uniref:Sulfhydryl oxidase n=1 Tax=Holothuria leucospilota TaxID=206669 RepID=A0A9Q1HBJ9_HOLLE|nr:Sulfhydryl oxidase 1 [Holothuria leucospilota]
MATSIHICYLLILFCHFCVIFPPSVDGKEAGLYKPLVDDVVILVENNFYQTVFMSEKAWIVELYSSWCGHCVHFAPTWKKFATDIKAWNPIVAVAAIDCAVKENHAICQGEQVKGYPTIKQYTPHAKNGSGIYYKGTRDVDSMRMELAKYVMGLAALPNWPQLKIVNSTDILSFHDHLNDIDSSGMFVIFEEKGSTLGVEVILDLSNVEDLSRQVLRMEATDENPLKSKWSVKEVPSVFVWPSDGEPKQLDVKSRNREGLRRAILDNYKPKTAEEGPGKKTGNKKVGESKGEKLLEETRNKTQPQKEGEEQNPAAGQLEAVLKASNISRNYTYLADIESALHYSLRIEVPSRTLIIGEELAALKNYVSVLNKYFPARRPVAEFLSNIDQQLQGSTWSAGIPVKTWNMLVDPVQSIGWLPAEENWVGCIGSSHGFRGYPCSVWTLFHVLSVTQAEVDENNLKSNSLEVLRTMRGYILNFFGCVECSLNFEKESSNILAEVSDLDSAILWLWKTHNRVNKRLSGDETEDPAFPKNPFPPSSLCGPCHNSVDDAWNEHEVLRYLKHRYSPANLNFTGVVALTGEKMHPRQINKRAVEAEFLRSELVSRVKRRKYNAEQGPAPKTFSVLGVTVFDVSLCLMLNLCCIMLVLCVYFVFFRRRKLKAFQSCMP